MERSYLIISEPDSVVDNRKIENMIEKWFALWVKVWSAENLGEHFHQESVMGCFIKCLKQQLSFPVCQMQQDFTNSTVNQEGIQGRLGMKYSRNMGN